MSKEQNEGKKEQNNQIIIYSTADGETKLEVKLENETVWLSQDQMAELFNCGVANISLHLINVFKEAELSENSVIKESLITAADNKKYIVKLYNLDAIISVGYRINSLRGTQFRIWATQKLKEYIIKGFVLDDERLSDGRVRKTYFQELEERIRKIRTSEANFYQKVRDIFATSIDYDSKTDYAKKFFAMVQLQTVKEKLMYMRDWVKRLDLFLVFNEEKILNNAGSVSHQDMEEKVRLELAKYNQKKLN